MIDEKRHKGLGRGLSALLNEDDKDYTSPGRLHAPREVPVEQITPNPFQPRQRFDSEEIDTLADSIREHGILQPIVVRRHFEGGNRYEIIAGERRWRAAQRAQLHQVPIIIRDIDDAKLLEVALVENVQREDLSPLEEANAYQRLIDDFGHTQNALGRIFGKSRSQISNTLRLLGLPDMVKAMLEDRAISAGHARALLTASNPEALAQAVINEQLSVRETEQRAQGRAERVLSKKRTPPEKDPDTLALEKDLSTAIGLGVEIRSKSNHNGEVKIRYVSLEQLDEICRRLRDS